MNGKVASLMFLIAVYAVAFILIKPAAEASSPITGAAVATVASKGCEKGCLFEGRCYDAGNTITFDSSLWECQANEWISPSEKETSKSGVAVTFLAIIPLFLILVLVIVFLIIRPRHGKLKR